MGRRVIGLVVACVFVLGSSAMACPNCKDATQDGTAPAETARRSRSYFVSILMMGSSPFVSVAGLGLYCARRRLFN